MGTPAGLLGLCWDGGFRFLVAREAQVWQGAADLLGEDQAGARRLGGGPGGALLLRLLRSLRLRTRVLALLLRLGLLRCLGGLRLLLGTRILALLLRGRQLRILRLLLAWALILRAWRGLRLLFAWSLGGWATGVGLPATTRLQEGSFGRVLGRAGSDRFLILCARLRGARLRLAGPAARVAGLGLTGAGLAWLLSGPRLWACGFLILGCAWFWLAWATA